MSRGASLLAKRRSHGRARRRERGGLHPSRPSPPSSSRRNAVLETRDTLGRCGTGGLAPPEAVRFGHWMAEGAEKGLGDISLRRLKRSTRDETQVYNGASALLLLAAMTRLADNPCELRCRFAQ